MTTAQPMKMTDADLIPICDEACLAFRDLSVIHAPPNKLKLWLVALSTIRPPAEETREWNRTRADVLKHLLQVHVTVTLHRRTFCLSIISLIVAVAALLISWLRATK
jgi:hypothetical protein